MVQTGTHIPGGAQLGKYVTHDKMDIVQGSLYVNSTIDLRTVIRILEENDEYEAVDSLFGAPFDAVVLDLGDRQLDLA